MPVEGAQVDVRADLTEENLAVNRRGIAVIRPSGTNLLLGVSGLAAGQRTEVRCPVAGQVPSTRAADEARLAAAEAADGKKDHVVFKCAVCRLGMDGVSGYSASYGRSEMHFCSAECKEAFEHDPVAAVRRLPLPTS